MRFAVCGGDESAVRLCRMLAGDGHQVRAFALDEARANGASLPVAALVDQFYADVQKLGGNRDDTSSLIRRLK